MPTRCRDIFSIIGPRVYFRGNSRDLSSVQNGLSAGMADTGIRAILRHDHASEHNGARRQNRASGLQGEKSWQSNGKCAPLDARAAVVLSEGGAIFKRDHRSEFSLVMIIFFPEIHDCFPSEIL